jgi:hypothetical protein
MILHGAISQKAIIFIILATMGTWNLKCSVIWNIFLNLTLCFLFICSLEDCGSIFILNVETDITGTIALSSDWTQSLLLAAVFEKRNGHENSPAKGNCETSESDVVYFTQDMFSHYSVLWFTYKTPPPPHTHTHTHREREREQQAKTTHSAADALNTQSHVDSAIMGKWYEGHANDGKFFLRRTGLIMRCHIKRMKTLFCTRTSLLPALLRSTFEYKTLPIYPKPHLHNDSVRNGNLEMPVYFLKAKQGYIVTKMDMTCIGKWR